MFVGLSQLPGDLGRQATKLLEKFVAHAVPAVAAFTPGFIAGGIGLMFYESLLGRFLRRWVCLPIVEVFAHSVAVGAGTAAGLLVSAAFAAEARPSALALGKAAAILVLLYFQLSVILLGLRGRFDRHLGSTKVAEILWTAVGVAVVLGAVLQLGKDLKAADKGTAPTSQSAH